MSVLVLEIISNCEYSICYKNFALNLANNISCKYFLVADKTGFRTGPPMPACLLPGPTTYNKHWQIWLFCIDCFIKGHLNCPPDDRKHFSSLIISLPYQYRSSHGRSLSWTSSVVHLYATCYRPLCCHIWHFLQPNTWDCNRCGKGFAARMCPSKQCIECVFSKKWPQKLSLSHLTLCPA